MNSNSVKNWAEMTAKEQAAYDCALFGLGAYIQNADGSQSYVPIQTLVLLRGSEASREVGRDGADGGRATGTRRRLQGT